MCRRPDVHAIARVRNALERGRWADAPDRALARRLGVLCPGAAELVRKVREFHRKAARAAIAAGAAGVVYAGSGFPADPMPHMTRTGNVMHGQHVFAYPDEGVTFVNQGETRHERVTAITAAGADPAGLMGMPEVQAIEGRLQVQLQLLAQYWPAEEAARITAAYAGMLPSGSSLVLTLGSPVTAEGRQFAKAVEDAIGMPVHAHTAADVRCWLESAGLEPDIRVLTPKDKRCGGVIITAIATVP